MTTHKNCGAKYANAVIPVDCWPRKIPKARARRFLLAGSSSSRLWKPSLARISSAIPALISANSALTSGPAAENISINPWIRSDLRQKHTGISSHPRQTLPSLIISLLLDQPPHTFRKANQSKPKNRSRNHLQSDRNLPLGRRLLHPNRNAIINPITDHDSERKQLLHATAQLPADLLRRHLSIVARRHSRRSSESESRNKTPDVEAGQSVRWDGLQDHAEDEHRAARHYRAFAPIAC